MARVTVRVDTGEAGTLLERAIAALEPPLITDALDEGAFLLEQGARRRAPVRTGALRGSIDTEFHGAYAFEVGPNQPPYDVVQEYGAVIKPRRAKALRFEIGGEVIFAKRVVVPARPYMEPTYVEDGPAALDAIAEAILRNIP